MLNGEVVLAVGALAAAIVLAALWRGAAGRATELESDKTEALSERDALRTKLASETQGRKKQAEELAALRKRADKTKKRQAKSADQPLGTASRIRDLETEIERAEHARRSVEIDRDALTARVSELERELATTSRNLEQALAPTRSVVADAEGALASAKSQAAEAREQRVKLEDALRVARETEARMRKRMNNQEQLYASLRAELDVKKDRLRTQEEQIQRLQALKVAVAD